MEWMEKSFSNEGNGQAAQLLTSKVNGLKDVSTECLHYYVTEAVNAAAGPGQIITILELPPHKSN